MSSHALTVSVDRVEGAIVVLEGDDGRHFEAPARAFTESPREGMIYRVALDASGNPAWETARADHAEASRRREELSRRMKARRDRDGGGDIEL
jgi:hypothetical protein